MGALGEGKGQGKKGAVEGFVDKMNALFGIKKPEPEKEEETKTEQPLTYYYSLYKSDQEKTYDTVYEKLLAKIPESFKPESAFGLEKYLEKPIAESLLQVTPADVFALAVYGMLLTTMVSMFLIFAVPGSSIVTIIALLFPLLISGSLFAYPFVKAKMRKMAIIGQAPLAILYLVISLRVTPSLESAVAFAAKNMPDPIGREFRDMMWSIEMRAQTTIENAIYAYSKSIKKWAPGFSDGLYLVGSSVNEPTEVLRIATLEKAIALTLENTENIMEAFVRKLDMPVMAVNALAILLPVMGLILAPVMSIFTGGTNMGFPLVIAYDFFLPTFVLLLILSILSGRPGSFSRIDFSLSPEVPRWGVYPIKQEGQTINLPIMPISLLVFLTFSSINLYLGLLTNWRIFSPMIETGTGASALSTAPIVMGTGMALGLYCFLNTSHRVKVRNRVKELEREFASALYQFGNVLDQGEPIENALRTTASSLEGTESSRFFQDTVRNIESFGLPLHLAIFDKQYGSIKYFPSSLIRNIMHVLVESSDRGPKAVSLTAMSISKYLQNLQTVQNKIEDLLSDAITSMRFQGLFLIPMVSGVVVGMSQLITSIIGSISQQINQIFASGGVASGGMIMGGILNVQGIIQPSFLQIVVGFFGQMMFILMGLFIGGLESGPEDVPSIMLNIGQLLIVGTFFYIVTTAIVSLVFGAIGATLVS